MMDSVISIFLSLFSVIVPTKMWYPPGQPMDVRNTSESAVTLVLTDFAGRPLVGKGDLTLQPGGTRDLHTSFDDISKPGTFVLYAVPEGKNWPTFVGTPIVVGVRQDQRRGSPPGPMVTKLEPLRFATLDTDQGEMTAVFYYDVAPITIASFQTLADQGYFDGMVFHRVVPGFVIQGGDPRGNDPDVNVRGSGSPGFTVGAEFNERPHVAGVLSMARSGDPNERSGAMPRPEFANSAGSQFFICLDEANTRQLDGRYTAFGTIVQGMGTVNKIAALPLADPAVGRPTTPAVIKSIRVTPVTPGHNPYEEMMKLTNAPAPVATTRPASD